MIDHNGPRYKRYHVRWFTNDGVMNHLYTDSHQEALSAYESVFQTTGYAEMTDYFDHKYFHKGELNEGGMKWVNKDHRLFVPEPPK